MIRFTMLRWLELVCASCLLACCGDRELEARRAGMAMEIKRLEAELAVLQSEAGEPLPDRSAELAAAQKELADTKAGIIELEQQVTALAAEKQVVEKEFAAYQRKYRIQPKSE